MPRYSEIVKEQKFKIKKLDSDLKESIELLGRLYDALVEMPSLSSATQDLLGETDDFIKKFD